MIWVAIALMFLGMVSLEAFSKWLKFQRELKLDHQDNAQLPPEAAIEDLRADINRIKLMLNIRTFKAEGEKK